MLNLNRKKLGITTSLTLALLVAGCGQEGTDNAGTTDNASNSGQMNYKITGLEPGAGQTEMNEEVLAKYENLAGWEQELSSTGAMLSAVDDAIKDEEPIMFTAWSPHYMFAKWDLKFLEDPEGVFGQDQEARTIVRKGLKEDNPTAYAILDRIYWEVSDIESALLTSFEEELEMDALAQRWVDENPEAVAEWTNEIAPVDGVPVELVSTPWDSEVFTANVAKIVLEQQGHDVTLTLVDPAIMFKSVATGDADASLSPWMPTTHADQYAAYEEDFENLGPAYEGARIGLAVPTYMEEDSLADFEPAE